MTDRELAESLHRALNELLTAVAICDRFSVVLRIEESECRAALKALCDSQHLQSPRTGVTASLQTAAQRLRIESPFVVAQPSDG